MASRPCLSSKTVATRDRAGKLLSSWIFAKFVCARKTMKTKEVAMHAMSTNRVGRALIAVALCALLLITGCQVKSVTVNSSVTTGPNGTSATIGVAVVIDPPGSDLASVDTTQGLIGMSLSNATLSSTTGTFTVRIKDLTTSAIVGQQSFGYLVKGNSFYAQDPTAVYNWLQQFTGYANVDVLVDAAPTVNTTSPGSASATSSAVYQGTTYASATASWEYVADPVQCTGGRCPVQP